MTPADGTYAVDDILGVAHAFARSSQFVILGARETPTPTGLPDLLRLCRDHWPDRMFRIFLRLFTGLNLIDGQSRLRAFPAASLSRLLRVPGAGWDYEFAMLLHVAQTGHPLAEHLLAVSARSQTDRTPQVFEAGLAFIRALFTYSPVEETTFQDLCEPLHGVSSEGDYPCIRESRAKQIG